MSMLPDPAPVAVVAPVPAMGGGVQIDVSALSMDGDADDAGMVSSPINPTVGDTVDITATATVTAVDGGVATLAIDSVNGMPTKGGASGAVSGTPSETDFDNDGSAGAAIRARAQGFDTEATSEDV